MCTLIRCFGSMGNLYLFFSIYYFFCYLLSWMFPHDCLDTCCVECLICMCFVFCICTCSAQLSMVHMERRSRNTLIIIIVTFFTTLSIFVYAPSNFLSRDCVSVQAVDSYRRTVSTVACKVQSLDHQKAPSSKLYPVYEVRTTPFLDLQTALLA